MLVLSGPSGVGKSTISRKLSEMENIPYVVSATTRSKRPGEEKGKKYEYLSHEEFFRRLDKDDFLEYAEVYGDYYGTPKHPTVDDVEAGRDVLLEIEIQGALQVRYQYPQCLTVFISPPDEPTLLRRLQARGRDSEQEIAKRFRSAKREINMAKGSKAFDYMVVNDDLNKAVDEIAQIMKHKRSGDKQL
jgi:guanylate kinase